MSRLAVRLAHVARGVLALLCCGSALHAVAPNFASITPAGAQRGSTVDVTLRGDRLADAQELFLYTPGITVEKIFEAADKQVKATLKIAADCPLGEHPLRLRTATGISSLRLFFVGPFPNVAEKEPNNTAAKPQPLALDRTVEGTLGNEDIDYFAVEAKQGQRLSVEVEGARLGRTMFDPIVTIHDATGKTLASSDDTPLLLHDGFISLVAPADGKYLIQLRDVTLSGANHVYRLHVGSFSRPAAVFPLGGKPGETLAAKFLGDPTGEFTQQLTLARSTHPLRAPAIAERNGLAPSPNWIRLQEIPTVTEPAPAATLAKAPLLSASAPFAFDGILTRKGEAAFFRFTAKKDQHLEFQVFARRLGSPLDSVLTVLDAKGKSLGNNDDASGNPDSMVRVKIPADGDYIVKLADQLNRGGPLFTYRIEITEVHPALLLSIPDTARYDNETRKSLVVPRGNRFAILLNLARDLCNDDLAVAFDGLPAGITLHADMVPGSLSAVPVVFEAAADAPLAGNLLTPTARPVDPAKSAGPTTRYRHHVDWVRIQNDTVYSRSEVGEIAAAVVEEVPFKIRVVEPKVPLVPSGEMLLQIVAERREGFDEPITVKMLWNPPGVSSLPDMVIPKGSTTVAYKLNSTAKAEVRKWKIAVIASATVEKGLAHVSSQLTELEIAPPFIAGKIDLTKVARGESARLVCKLEQKIPFEGTAVARLVGLPANTTAAPVEITQDSKEAVFTVVTTDKSPVGLTKNLSCAVVVTQNAEPITHLIAPGSVLRIDPAKPKSTVAAAKE